MRAQTDAVWLNGTLTRPSSATLNPLSHGLLYGAGVYDAILLHHGVPVALERHLLRLATGAARLSLTVPSAETVRRAIQELSASQGLDHGRIRITLAAGPSPNIQSGSPADQLTLITLAPVTPPKPGAAVTLTPFRRNEHSPLAGIKFTACPENLLVQRAALDAGFDEAIFLNTAGRLCEGAFSNIFLVRHNQVLTPPLTDGCLPGVTREIILEQCHALGIPCIEQQIPAGNILPAAEIFLTSSIRGVQPVHQLDHSTFPAPGPLTRRIADAYAEWLNQQTIR